MVAAGKRDYPAERRARAKRGATEASILATSRPIPGFEGRYSALPNGSIWSHLTYKFLKPQLERRQDQDFYFQVMLRVDGRSVTHRVHRLVCAAFHGTPPAGMEANHIDLVKTNNAESNLEWATPKQNSQHAWDNLPKEISDRRRRAVVRVAAANGRKKRKLSREQVAAARAMLSAGRPHSEIAPLFGVCRATISNLASGVCYRD
jgi:hypothetical protein